MKTNITSLYDCYGCGVCGGVCPKDIIDLKIIDGFLRPTISNQNNCIECGLCLKVCSFNHRDELDFSQNIINAYAATSNSQETILTSTSGGVIPELIKTALSLGWHAIAVRFNIEKNAPEHYIITTLSDIDESKRSKYLQSDISKATNLIDWNQKYIVVGTPCQIASFRTQIKLRKKEDNFVLIDFFCHGLPSYKLWDSYLKMKKITPMSLKEVFFRNKNFGWHKSIRVLLVTKNGKEYIAPSNKRDVFFDWFLKDRCLTNACYDNCKFKQTNSYADIRVGDLWGIDYMNEDSGMSGVVTHTQLGDWLMNQCTSINKKRISPSIILSGQMTRNAQRAKSYRIANFGLKKGLSLSLMNKICTLIDDAYYYYTRIIAKIKNAIQ